MSVSTDPFSRVEQAIYDVLFSHKPLAAIVKPKNRISTVSTRPDEADPFKDRTADADYPAIEILAAGGGQFKSPTGTLLFMQRYQIGMASTDVRTNRSTTGINPVKWETLRALERARTSLNPPGLPGLDFVTRFDIGDYSDGLTDPEKQVPGWVSLLGIEVHMKFSAAEMTA